MRALGDPLHTLAAVIPARLQILSKSLSDLPKAARGLYFKKELQGLAERRTQWLQQEDHYAGLGLQKEFQELIQA